MRPTAATPRGRAVVAFLRENGPATAHEISEGLEKRTTFVSHYRVVCPVISNLLESGDIRPTGNLKQGPHGRPGRVYEVWQE